MRRLIDANALEKDMRQLVDQAYQKFCATDRVDVKIEYRVAIVTWMQAIFRVREAPTADAAEVRHGTWEKANIDGFLRCSICHDCYIDDNWLDGKHWNFCPHCGADLRGEENGEK